MPATFAGYARASEGLQLTEENKAAQIAALVREAEGYEARSRASRSDEDRERWADRAEQVREQLRLRGQDAAAPVRRASKRLAADAETR
jgi:hypothetical protein